jgi:hypothetical protein
VTPNQEQVELASDHEDSEPGATRVDLHRRSASASGLIAMAVHASIRNEIQRSCCGPMAKASVGGKMVNCSGLHASLYLCK